MCSYLDNKCYSYATNISPCKIIYCYCKQNYRRQVRMYCKPLINYFLLLQSIPKNIIINTRNYIQMQYNKQENERLLKILIIGNSGVGKSCMLMRYVENNFTTAFYNTIGVDFKMKNIQIDGRKVRMQVWDTAGQDRFRTITSTYYKGAHGIILVYDVTDRQSFEGLKFWLQQIEKYASQNVDKLVVGNKSDQAQKRKVSYDEGYQFAKTFKLDFTQVSALSATNIGQAFQMIAKKVLKRLDSTPMPVNRPVQKLQKKKSQQNGGCC